MFSYLLLGQHSSYGVTPCVFFVSICDIILGVQAATKPPWHIFAPRTNGCLHVIKATPEQPGVQGCLAAWIFKNYEPSPSSQLFNFCSAVLSPIVFLKAWSKGQHRTPKNAFEAAKTMDNPCPSLPYFTGHWLLIFLIGVGGGRQLKSCDTFLGWFSIQPLLQAPRLHWIHLNSRYKTREESELKCQGSTSSDSSTKGFSKFFER